MSHETSYITLIKKYFPKVGIQDYVDSDDYNSIQFVNNGAVIPTKAELDALLSQDNFGYFEADSGKIIKTYFGQINIFTGNSTIPFDNTAPAHTEGSQIVSTTIVPVTEFSKFSFSASFILDCDSSNKLFVIALYRNNTCVYTTSTELSGKRISPISIEFADSPNTTDAVTYSIRVGCTSRATWYVNQDANGHSNGGTTKSFLKISEYA